MLCKLLYKIPGKVIDKLLGKSLNEKLSKVLNKIPGKLIDIILDKILGELLKYLLDNCNIK